MSNSDIQKAIDDLFDLSLKLLKDKMINAFIPFGGIKKISANHFYTDAFDDELGELIEFLKEYIKLVDQFISNPKQKTRLLVQMYCRIIENDYQYLVIYNLLHMLNGLDIDWEFKTLRNGEMFYCEHPTSKIDEICKLCKVHGLTIGKILKNLLKADLRNSFYHSQYTLLPNGSFLNTRFYSPASTVKPSKKIYKSTEIDSLYHQAEYFLDNFFRRFCAERKRFKNGKNFLFGDNKSICWNPLTNRWIFNSNNTKF